MVCLYGIVTTRPAVVGARPREIASSTVAHSVLWKVQGRLRDWAMWLCMGGAMEWVTPMPTRCRVRGWASFGVWVAIGREQLVLRCIRWRFRRRYSGGIDQQIMGYSNSKFCATGMEKYYIILEGDGGGKGITRRLTNTIKTVVTLVESELVT